MALFLLLFGLYEVGQAAWMAVGPHSFYEAVGPFGAYNDHYVRDAAALTFGLGAVLLIAARRPSWRAPALAANAIAFGVHAINHLVDIGDADPESVGYIDFVSLTLGAVLLAALAARAAREEART